uniref:BSD domain-containing protein n=1 Tax=Aureoumbra lagunensis TaxID=44058 RepID=A0A7S3K608_9STRA|mmetsp:Transcript_19267/g.29234  ORF Transcript_19267/g.29234 Transcript_19267/m.29234 type:complete len:557 (+) Transcript_19267:155-1825(+)
MSRIGDGEELFFRFRSRYQKADGTVDLTNKGVRWFNTESSVWIPIDSIEKHEVSPENHSKAMIRILRKSASAVVLTILEATPKRAYEILCSAKVTLGTILKEHRKKKRSSIESQGEILGQKRKKFLAADDDNNHVQEKDVPIQKEDTRNYFKSAIERRQNELRANAALGKVYRELVGGGIMSEEEFWKPREEGIIPYMHTEKKTIITAAMSNDLLVDAPPDNTTENTVTYRITKKKKLYIFKMYPAVERAYQALVNKSLTEEEFWIKYFQSKFFLRDKGEAVVLAAKSHTNNQLIDDDLFARYEKDTDNSITVNTQKRHASLILQRNTDDVDLIDNDLEPPAPGSAQIGPVTPSAARILHKVNRHSVLVTTSIKNDMNQNIDEKLDNLDDDQEDNEHDNELNRTLPKDYISLRIDDHRKDEQSSCSFETNQNISWSHQEDSQSIQHLANSAATSASSFAFLLRKSRSPVADKPPPQPFRQEAEEKVLLALHILHYAYCGLLPPESIRVKLLSLRQDIDSMRSRIREHPPLGAGHAAMLKPLSDQLNLAISTLCGQS